MGVEEGMDRQGWARQGWAGSELGAVMTGRGERGGVRAQAEEIPLTRRLISLIF